MIQNLGMLDRMVRGVVGLALLAFLLLAEGSHRWFGLIGLIPLITGLFSFCPLYRLVGFNTCRRCD